jgi:hypothetical protein
MYLLTYSWTSPLDGKLRQHSVATDDWISMLARVYQRHHDAALSVVFLCELSPLEKRRLDELRAAGVEVEQ